jgi:hypothetical protein
MVLVVQCLEIRHKGAATVATALLSLSLCLQFTVGVTLYVLELFLCVQWRCGGRQAAVFLLLAAAVSSGTSVLSREVPSPGFGMVHTRCVLSIIICCVAAAGFTIRNRKPKDPDDGELPL